jgi:hypothetical protein
MGECPMSREYNSAGTTLLVDEVIEVGSTFNKVTSKLQQAVEKTVMRRNYSAVAKNIADISSDNYISPKEKLSLYRELNSIKSSYSSLVNQATESGFGEIDSESYQVYLAYLQAFSALNLYVGPLVADTTTGKEVDGATLASKFIAYYQASASLEDEVFYSLNKQQETLSLILSATTFAYDAYGGIKPLIDEQGERTAQVITVYTAQNGIGEEIVMTVNGTPVAHSFGEYAITPEAMVGRTFILVKVTCGNLTRSNIITKVIDGGDAVSVQILSLNGNSFRPGTCNTTMIASVWRGETDITESLPESAFNWKRSSNSSVWDDSWNTSSKAIGHKSIELTPEDVLSRAVFTCEVEI